MDYCEKITYDSKRRFCSYWHQIQEALAIDPRNILEVGIGTGFISRYIKAQGIPIVTCDIDAAKHPDAVGSVSHLPFADGAFDVAIACEVLEHMPYEETLVALQELRRVCSRRVVISVPDATPIACVQFPLPYIKKIRFMISMPRLFPLPHRITKHGHQWEIGKKDYPLSRVIGDMQKMGFVLERTYRVFENPYHRFFILAK